MDNEVRNFRLVVRRNGTERTVSLVSRVGTARKLGREWADGGAYVRVLEPDPKNPKLMIVRGTYRAPFMQEAATA